ncbi:MAG TPA: heme-binding protein [Blastocatellia bacterium]
MRVRFNLSIRTIVFAVLTIFVIGLCAAFVSEHLLNRTSAATANSSVAVVSVNAASFAGPLAPGAIAAAFGADLCTRLESAQVVPLPTNLAGTTVRVTDSRNVQHNAQLFFVSPGQVNYLIPEQAALGTAQITITNAGGIVSRGDLQLVATSPAIFTLSYSGRGLPVALTTYDGIFYDRVVNPDGSPRAVDPGTDWRPNYLLLFGTGLRNAKNLRVRIGSTEITPLYVGPQGGFAGLDQINLALSPKLTGGMHDISLITDGEAGNNVQLLMAGAPDQTRPAPFVELTQLEVQTVIAQAVTKAQQLGVRATVGVVSREGDLLGVFKMTGARTDVKLGVTDLLTGQARKSPDPDGLEQMSIPIVDGNGQCVVSQFNPLRRLFCDGPALAALSKAGTAAYFSTLGNAFTTRSASFIIQEHLPPLIDFTPAGPLFGVQFSQLPCSDVRFFGRFLPFGLAGDPGGVPLYKGRSAVGGVGIEVDGFYSIDIDPSDQDQSVEEIIAVAATQGFEAPDDIRGDKILVDGMQLPFVNAPQTGVQAAAYNTLPGTALLAPQGTPASLFTPLTLGGIPGRVDARFYPFRASASTSTNRLTADDVNRIITQAAQQAYRTRAAIRRPLNSPAEVNISVVDTSGAVLGLFSTFDAPIFGFDVCVQKARTSALFSSANAGAQLRSLGPDIAKFADAAAADGIRLDGSIAFSDRAGGFLSRPFLPDGINGTPNGPFSKPINVWSPFNDGLQIALIKRTLMGILSGTINLHTGCVQGFPGQAFMPNIANGTQIFAGSVPLYKNGVLVGAIGISGDGIDQDDIIASSGSVGFEAPEAIRADQFFVRGVRLPYVKFPRHPNL